MKMKHYYFLSILLLLMGACDDLMNPTPTVGIDPGFASSGFTSATITSQNESDVYQMTYSRNYGISRDLTMTITIDAAALETYNQENSTDYKLLPAEYYTMPTSATFEVKSKSADFDITFYSKKLYELAGSIDAASKYVLPIKAINNTDEIADVDESKNTVFLHINMQASTISPLVPASPTELFFARGSESSEVVTMAGSVNFSGVDASLISLVVDADAPLLTSGGYELLPETNYSFESVVVTSDGGVSITGLINAIGLSDETQYLLPCYFKSSDSKYVINQESPIYYTVTVTELEVSITNASDNKAVSAYWGGNTNAGTVNVTINTLLSEDLTINFAYDPSLITAFNTRVNGTYGTLPDGAVEVTNEKIAAGDKSVNIAYKIDMSSLTLASGDHYLVPLVLQEGELELGSVFGSEVIYLDVARTLEGTYNLTIIDNERTRGIGNTIWAASKCPRISDATWAKVAETAQYGFGGDGDYYSVLFSVTNEDMAGKANCKKIQIYTFLELLEEDGGTNKVTQNNSYFNTVTGEVYIDCYVYESWFAQNYKETYSFTK